VALLYGSRKKLDHISIGQAWHPTGAPPAAPTKAWPRLWASKPGKHMEFESDAMTW